MWIKIHLSGPYIWKTNIWEVKCFPILKMFPNFYQDVILAYNKCKHIRPFDNLNVSEVFEQPLWGNEYFKIKGESLYFRKWAISGILYVKDLVNDNGLFKDDEELYYSVNNRVNILKEIFIIKKYIIKRLAGIDTMLAKSVRISESTIIVF